MPTTRYLLSSLDGLEDVVAADAEDLGARPVALRQGRVLVEADAAFCHRANLAHPTTSRVLQVMAAGEVESLADVERLVRSVAWEEHFGAGQSFAGDAHRVGEHPFTSLDVARAVGDGVIARFRDATGARPPVDLREPDVRVVVDVRGADALVCVDTTGRSLHMRGYRVAPHPAPLAPTLASAMVRLSGWREGLLLDPMCGSGTIPIEASLRAGGRAVNLAREDFAFRRLRSFDAAAFAGELARWEAREPTSPAGATDEGRDAPPRAFGPPWRRVVGNERDPRRAAGARENARAAGAEVDFWERDFHDLPRPEGLSAVVTNPPWGRRMTSRRTSERVHEQLGAKLAEWAPASAVVLVAGRRFEKRMPPAEARDVLYGGTACRLLRYAG